MRIGATGIAIGIAVGLVLQNMQAMAKDLPPLFEQPQREASGSYGKLVNGDAGNLIHLPDFDIFSRGELAMSFADKKHNDDSRAKGMDGGYVTNNYIFNVMAKNGAVLAEIKLQQMPFSWQSFVVAGKTYTITNVLNDGTLPYKPFIIYEGDISQARRR